MARSIFETLGEYFAPLLLATEDFAQLEALVRDLGWRITLTDGQAELVENAMALKGPLEALADLIDSIEEAGGTVDEAQIEEGMALIQSLFDALQTFANGSYPDLATLPLPFSDTAVLRDMALELPEYLLLVWLRENLPAVYAVLLFAGPMSETPRDDLPDKSEMDWQKLTQVFTDPAGLFVETYGWGEDFDFHHFARALERLFVALGTDGFLAPLRDAADALIPDAPPELCLPLVPRAIEEALAGAQAELVLRPVMQGAPVALPVGVSLEARLRGPSLPDFDLGNGWLLAVQTPVTNTEFRQSMEIYPDRIEADLAPLGGPIGLTLTGAPESPWVLFGAEDGMRLELARFSAEIGAEVGGGPPDLQLGFSTLGGDGPGLSLVIAPGEGDGFLSELLGASPIVVGADIGAHWSHEGGFVFEGGVGFDVTLPLDLHLGPIRLDRLRLSLMAGTEGLEFEAGLTAGADIGVVAVAVEEVGLRVEVLPLPQGDTSGALGPLDLKLGFKPPNGLGLVIDAAGVVTGGGYLFHDDDAAEYAGVAELGFLSVSLSAIGILTTRMPDGSDGWSLFLSVFSTFPPIQLGFGITLNGVGGLVGLHRSFDDEALRLRLADGALESLMFPEDPVANAPQILADIRAVFPPAQGQFVFGIMARLAWGTPSLLTVDLGVIVELPDPIKIALLGRVHVALPEPDTAVIELNMDVFGVANLSDGTLALDAVLRDSHIAHLITLSGSMALRASFGDRPSMLLSIGGFNPKFTPPPGVPALDRMRAALPLGSYAAVDLTAYVAITSNTFQTGGRIDVWVKVTGFSAEGYFSFDALIQFSPFGFEFVIGFGVTVRAGNTTLMGVDVAATVTGPGLWHIDGYAEFKILGLKKKLNVDLEIGERKRVEVPSYDVAAMLADALAVAEAWQVIAPGGALSVQLRALGPAEVAGADPLGAIELRQKIVPLNLKIDKFGAGTVNGAKLFEITQTRLGASASSSENVLEDWFAPAEFIKMSDAEKLKAPSFESLDCGVSFGSGAIGFGAAAELTDNYEQIIIDPELNQRSKSLAPDLAKLSAPRKTAKAAGVKLAAPRYEAMGKDGNLHRTKCYAEALRATRGTGKPVVTIR